MNISADVMLMLPELLLAIGAMALLLTGAIAGEKAAPAISLAAILLLLVCGAAVVLGGTGSAFHGAFIEDGFSRFAKILILIGSAFSILLGVYPKPVFDVTTPAVAKLISDNKTALALAHNPSKVAVNQKASP